MFFPPRLMTLGKFSRHILDAKTLASKEDDKVIEHIGAFVDETVVGTIGGFDN